MRDHLLGFPGLLALIEPDTKPAKRDSGLVWPFPLHEARLIVAGPVGSMLDSDAHGIYGPAQAPQSESSRDKPAASSGSVETPEAAPPSGRWVLTSERRPPIGMHQTRPAGLTRNSWERYFNGYTWRVEQGSDPCLEQNREWFEPQVATPQPDADGWIEHKGGGLPKCLKVGMKVDIRCDRGKEFASLTLARDDGPGWFPTSGRRITHYRVVKP